MSPFHSGRYKLLTSPFGTATACQSAVGGGVATTQPGFAFGRVPGVEHCGTVFYFARRIWRGLLVSAPFLPDREFSHSHSLYPLRTVALHSHPCPLCRCERTAADCGPLKLPLCCRHRRYHRRTALPPLSVYPRALPESTHPGCCNC